MMMFWHIFHVFLSSQGRISQLEEDLNDERSSADRLMERLDKTKEQAGSLTFYLLTFINSPKCEETGFMARPQSEHPALHVFLS